MRTTKIYKEKIDEATQSKVSNEVSAKHDIEERKTKETLNEVVSRMNTIFEQTYKLSEPTENISTE
jgi:hypothetical protein